MVEQLISCFVNRKEVSLHKLQEITVTKALRDLALLFLSQPFNYTLDSLLFVVSNVVPSVVYHSLVIVAFDIYMLNP
jgi:hypothetical protein